MSIFFNAGDLLHLVEHMFLIGEKKASLSVRQKQRIAIARAIFDQEKV